MTMLDHIHSQLGTCGRFFFLSFLVMCQKKKNADEVRVWAGLDFVPGRHQNKIGKKQNKQNGIELEKSWLSNCGNESAAIVVRRAV